MKASVPMSATSRALAPACPLGAHMRAAGREEILLRGIGGRDIEDDLACVHSRDDRRRNRHGGGEQQQQRHARRDTGSGDGDRSSAQHPHRHASGTAAAHGQGFGCAAWIASMPASASADSVTSMLAILSRSCSSVVAPTMVLVRNGRVLT